MLGCKMLKTSLPDHQPSDMVNVYSLHAPRYVKNVALSLGRQSQFISNYVDEKLWYIISNNTDSKFAR
jgi:hypothetical protein